jgi:hypothetical protein
LKTPSATVLLGDTDISPTKEWTTPGIQKSNAKAWHKEKCGVCYFGGHAEFVDQSFIKPTKKTDLFWKGVEWSGRGFSRPPGARLTKITGVRSSIVVFPVTIRLRWLKYRRVKNI